MEKIAFFVKRRLSFLHSFEQELFDFHIMEQKENFQKNKEKLNMSMPVIKPGTITRGEAVGDIISSIAIEEKAFAHILNAESEKIMAVVGSSDATAEDLLEINESVKRAMSAISRLEMQLQAKLEMFGDTVCQ